MVGGKWESNSVCPAPLKTDSRWESPSRVVSQSSSNEHASCSPLSLSLCYRHTHTVKALAIRPRAAGPSVWMCSAYQSRPNGKKEEDWEWKRRVGPYTQSYSGASFNLILIDFISVPPPLLLPVIQWGPFAPGLFLSSLSATVRHCRSRPEFVLKE